MPHRITIPDREWGPYDPSVGTRTATQSIESDIDRLAVLEVLADPTRIPEWAPDFADTVTGGDQSGWRATKNGRDFTVRALAQQDAGTVDYLREVAPGREGGPSSAWCRVLAVAASSS